MKRKPRRVYQARAEIAKALAHPTRLMVLEALQGKDRCVGELTDLVGADQSTVSKHLALLKNVGLVDVRKEGAMNYYRLTCPCLDGFFSCIESVLKDNLKARQALLSGR